MSGGIRLIYVMYEIGDPELYLWCIIWINRYIYIYHLEALILGRYMQTKSTKPTLLKVVPEWIKLTQTAYKNEYGLTAMCRSEVVTS